MLCGFDLARGLQDSVLSITMEQPQETYGAAVEYLKDVVNSINNSKLQEIGNTNNLYLALLAVEATAKSSLTTETELFANVNLNSLEEIFNSKFIVLNKSLQIQLLNLYELFFIQSPGYVIRNILNALLTSLNNKNIPIGTRECLISLLSLGMEKRSSDIGGMLTDIVTTFIRLIRSNEMTSRLLSLNGIITLYTTAGTRVNDLHSELFKLIPKLGTDRCAEIRQKCAQLLSAIASTSNGFSTLSYDVLFQAAVKGLEDEVNVVQEAYARAVAVIHLEVIHAHLEDQEQAKIGLARGGSAATDQTRGGGGGKSSSSQRGSLSKLKDMTSFKEMMSSTVTLSSSLTSSATSSSSTSSSSSSQDNDFKSVLKSLIRNLLKASTPSLRAGYVSVLRHLIQLLLPTILLQESTSNLEWLVMTIISILRDSQITSLSYEEIVYFRCRLSHLFHKGISALLSESNQMILCKTLSLYLSTTDPRTEHEIQFILSEICHLIQSLQELSVSLQDELKTMINIQLRHPSFGVRATAAYVLMSLASMIPAEASNYFKDALTGAAIQVKQLLSFDEADYSSSSGVEAMPSEESMTPSNSSTVANKKNPKDTERLQRMFYFHGLLPLLAFLSSSCSALILPTHLFRSLSGHLYLLEK
jgi:hypothetical protein